MIREATFVLATVGAIAYGAGCTKADDSKDNEIAALKAKLAAQQTPPPNPQPETVPPPVTESNEKTLPAPEPTLSPEQRIAKAVASGTMNKEEIQTLLTMANANKKTITYAHLKKNAERYTGKPWRLYGRILEISERNGRTSGRVALSDYDPNMVMYFEYSKETDLVQDNRIAMLGVLGGEFSYESQAGWKITIPSILVAAFGSNQSIDAIADIGGKKRHRSDSDE